VAGGDGRGTGGCGQSRRWRWRAGAGASPWLQASAEPGRRQSDGGRLEPRTPTCSNSYPNSKFIQNAAPNPQDWRDNHLEGDIKARNAALPTFLYAMPFSKTK
jgi:hypothetical protein